MSELSPAVAVVQKSLDAYNAHDADTFADCLAEGVRIGDEPYLTVGKQANRNGFAELFASSPHLYCTLLGCMLLGQYVIDKEYITGMAKPLVCLSVNRVVGGKIVSISFLDEDPKPGSEADSSISTADGTAEFSPAVEVLQRSLEAFNARDAQAFTDCLADEVVIGDEPYQTVGKAACYERYLGLFTRNPQINVTLLGRMVLAPYILDKEYVTGAGDAPFTAISINHVVNGKIASIRFLEAEEPSDEPSEQAS